jgi:hypothetical protein
MEMVLIDLPPENLRFNTLKMLSVYFSFILFFFSYFPQRTSVSELSQLLCKRTFSISSKQCILKICNWRKLLEERIVVKILVQLIDYIPNPARLKNENQLT